MKACRVAVLALLSVNASVAEAGWLMSIGPQWNSFSFEPEEEEATPNYYGYGPSLNLGYSFGQVFDIALFGRYAPGSRNPTRVIGDDAVMFSYGGELALRLGNSVYFGARGGQTRYQLYEQELEEEVQGRWEGIAAGGSLGAIFSLDKSRFWQISLDYMQAMLDRTDEDLGEDSSRNIAWFSVSLTYVFNLKVKSGGSGLFGDFMRSLSF